MTISAKIEHPVADERVADVHCDSVRVIVDLADGRTISVPLAWYPRLLHATPGQRANWQTCSDGYGIHWPEIDEDLHTEGLLRGGPVPEQRQDEKEAGLVDTSGEEDNQVFLPTARRNDDATNMPEHATFLSGLAFVLTDTADCHYEPDHESAIRIIPPYGEEVRVLEEKDGWILLEWLGKKAWAERHNLGNAAPEQRKTKQPYAGPIYQSSSLSSTPKVEIGSRGGIFTRTKSGYRRYL